MGNIAYFEIPSDDVERAKKFYAKVFGWEIKSTPMPGAPDYSSVSTGKTSVEKGMGQLNMGGMMKRMYPGQPITNYVEVDSVDKTLDVVKKNGGKQMGERLVIPTVGIIAFIFDSEGNNLGLWEAEKK
jgi:predicted enzyme related to lactoylglutathione lyase